MAKQRLTNTRAQRTKNRETLKKRTQTHTNTRKHSHNTHSSNTGRTTRSTTHKPKVPTPPPEPKPANRNPTTQRLHSLRHSTKIPSGKASAEGEDEPQRQSIRPNQERWQSIHQKARPLEVAKHPPKRISTSRTAKHPPN